MSGPAPSSASMDAKADARYAAIVVALMAAAQIMNMVDRAVVAVGAADIMRDLGLSPEEYGVLGSAFYSLHSITGIAVGFFLAHRVRPILLVTGMVAIWTVTQLPPILFPTFLTLIISRVVLGAAEAPCMPAAVATTHELFPAERRSVPTSIVWIGAMVGALVAPPILTVVIANMGWRAGFAVSAALSGTLFVALMIVSRMRNRPQEAAHEIAAVQEEGAKTNYWRDPTIISITVVGLCAYWMTAFSGTWLFPMVHLHWGYTPELSGWVTSAVFGLCALALLVVPALSQKMLKQGVSLRWAVVMPVAACLLVGSVLLASSALLSVGVLKLVFIAIGIALMPVVGATISVVISSIVPRQDRNRLLIVILALTSLAGLPAPYVTGWFINRLGADGYDAALLCCGAVTMAGGLLALRLMRRGALEPLK